jgi:large subunit ribosomal protein L4e
MHSAESWGTGRAVARIPRVSGSGTHRSGQGAFGNQCRKGRMFAPLHTWRRWHRRVNIKQKRHAVAAAIAASGIVPLVQARGHRVWSVPELPLVVDDSFEKLTKTKQAVAALKRLGAYDDVKRVVLGKKIRAGKGKLRNRRYQRKKGPLVVFGGENPEAAKALRNIPGVDTLNVHRLNLLQLAPGGQLGRFIIWTASAFEQLNRIFGTFRYAGVEKQGYQLNRPVLTNPDIARIINSNEVQSVVNAAKPNERLIARKKNPLKNKRFLDYLNPYAAVQRARAHKAQEDSRAHRKAVLG